MSSNVLKVVQTCAQVTLLNWPHILLVLDIGRLHSLKIKRPGLTPALNFPLHTHLKLTIDLQSSSNGQSIFKTLLLFSPVLFQMLGCDNRWRIIIAD